jgi:hypothetical protein
MTHHTIAYYSVQVVGITLRKTSFHEYYPQQSSTTKTLQVQVLSIHSTNLFTKDHWNLRDTIYCQVSSSSSQNPEEATCQLLHDKSYLESY